MSRLERLVQQVRPGVGRSLPVHVDEAAPALANGPGEHPHRLDDRGELMSS